MGRRVPAPKNRICSRCSPGTDSTGEVYYFIIILKIIIMHHPFHRLTVHSNPLSRAAWRWISSVSAVSFGFKSAEPRWAQRMLSSGLVLWGISSIVINARPWDCSKIVTPLQKLVMKPPACLCVLTDSARGLGQSQGGTHLHRDRPPPVHCSELQHHRCHVQGHRDREGNTRPAHGAAGGLLQAGHHGSTSQLIAGETGAMWGCRARQRSLRFKDAGGACVRVFYNPHGSVLTFLWDAR